MCGHGTIGLVATLAHLGRIGPGEHRIETPVGVVERHAARRRPGHRRERAELPLARGRGGRRAGLRQGRGDVAWGGNWFFLRREPPDSLERRHVDAADRPAPGASARRSQRRASPATTARDRPHRTVRAGRRGATAQLRAVPRQGLRPLALRHRHQRQAGLPGRRRQACAGRDLAQESIIGSVFEGRYEWGRGLAVLPSITGPAYVNAEATLILQPRPFRLGHQMSLRAIVVGAGIVGAACAERWPARRAGHAHRAAGRGGATAAGMGHLVVMDDNPAQLALTAQLDSGTRWPATPPAPSTGLRHPLGGGRRRGDAGRAAQARALRGGREAELLDAGGWRGWNRPCARAWRGPAGAGRRRGVSADAAQLLAARSGAALAGQVPPSRRRRAPGGRQRSRRHRGGALARLRAAAGPAGPPEERPPGHHRPLSPGFVRHQLVELGYIKSAHGRGDSVAFNVQPRPTGQLLIGSSRQFDAPARAVDRPMLRRMLAAGLRFMPGLARLTRCAPGPACAPPRRTACR